MMLYKVLIVLVGLYSPFSSARAETHYTDSDFLDAAKDCNVIKMQEIFNKGNISIDGYPDRVSPLMAAAQCESPEAVQFLISKKASLDLLGWASHEEYRRTAVIYAVECGKCIESLRALINAGANLNLNHRYSALSIAIINSSNAEAELLIRGGANLNIRSKWELGRTPLMFATYYENFYLAKLLIDNGADINLQDTSQRFTALHMAVNNSFNSSDKDQIASYLIRKGANLNIEDNVGYTPLFWSQNRTQNIFYELVNNGANIHHRDHSGATILIFKTFNYSFTKKEDLNIYKWILEKKVNINLQTYHDGISALMRAAKLGNFEAVEILLTNNASPNLRNQAGQTALTQCKESDIVLNEEARRKTIELLIKFGGTE